MFTANHNQLHGFMMAAPVNLALVMGVVGFPDYAWDIIGGMASFLVTVLVLSLPCFDRPRRKKTPRPD